MFLPRYQNESPFSYDSRGIGLYRKVISTMFLFWFHSFRLQWFLFWYFQIDFLVVTVNSGLWIKRQRKSRFLQNHFGSSGQWTDVCLRYRTVSWEILSAGFKLSSGRFLRRDSTSGHLLLRPNWRTTASLATGTIIKARSLLPLSAKAVDDGIGISRN